MRFKLFGVKIEARSVGKTEAAERRRLDVVNDQVLDEVPRLRAPGRVQFGELSELVQQGWTADDIRRIVDSWPTASHTPLTLIVSLAGQIRSRGVDDIDEINAWLHAIADEDPDGNPVPKPLVQAELARAGLPKNPAGAVNLWSEAAGSRPDGLIALRNRLPIADIAPK